MNRHRTLLSALLGLVLLLQGFAVAAAPYIQPVQASAMEAMDQMDMPCHTNAEDAVAGQKPCCCDADCPDMTTCALGHFAGMTLVSVTLPSAGGTVPGFAPVQVVTRTVAFPLRPPIDSHS